MTNIDPAKYNQPFKMLTPGKKCRVVGLFAAEVVGVFLHYLGEFNARGDQYVTLELPSGVYYDCARAHVRKPRKADK